MAWDDGLVGVALEIARTEESPLRVMAGPGTGKSFAMIRRFARLLEEGAEATRILAVTFTRNAAASLVTDLRELHVDGSEDIRAGTLHAFCFSLLRHEAIFEYLGRVARPLVTFATSGVLRFEAEPMLHDVKDTGPFGGVRDCTTRIRAFEAAWARLQSDDAGWPHDPTDKQFHQVLLDWLRFHQAMLIGEVVPESLRYLRHNPESPFRTAYDHVIVDEYQDLNRAEQDLIDLLASVSQVAIVGDVDQSIYSFRHANPEGIVEYAARHDPTHDEALIECRRCPTRVVAMADHLIQHNHPAGDGPRLQPYADNPEGEIHSIQWISIEEEANGLALFVSHLIEERGYEPGEILILSPRRRIGYAIRDALRDAGVSVHSFYHEEALEPVEAQRAFALLTLFCNPDDRVALRWWLGLGSPSWRKGQYGILQQYCVDNDISPRECLDRLDRGALRLARTNQLLERYRVLLAQLATLEGLDCAALVDHLLPAGEPWAVPLRIAAGRVLMDAEEASELLDALRVSITQPEMPEEGDFARVMSLHKSKGLTSKVVLVAGCIEGLTPMIKHALPEHEQRLSLLEQRRLFYVAITRCREILALSSVTTLDPAVAHRMGARTRPGGRAIASRFLDELGPVLLAPVRGSDWIENGFE